MLFSNMSLSPMGSDHLSLVILKDSTPLRASRAGLEGLWQNHHLGPTRGGGRGKWKKTLVKYRSLHTLMDVWYIWYMIYDKNTYIYIYIQMDGTTVLKHWMVAVANPGDPFRWSSLESRPSRPHEFPNGQAIESQHSPIQISIWSQDLGSWNPLKSESN